MEVEPDGKLLSHSKIKAFIIYNCGHRFHKKCITEKLLIEKEKRDFN